MLFFGKKKKNESVSNVKENVNLYQSNDINAPLPAASIPVVGQTIPTSSNEVGQTANPGVIPSNGDVKEPVAPVEPTPMPAQEPVAPVEPTPVPAQEPVAPVEPTPVQAQEPVAPVEPTPMPAQEPVASVEPTPMPAQEPVAPVEPTPMPAQEPVAPVPEQESTDNNASTLNQSMFIDQPRPEQPNQQANTEPKFCPNCGNKVEGDTCILCGTKI